MPGQGHERRQQATRSPAGPLRPRSRGRGGPDRRRRGCRPRPRAVCRDGRAGRGLSHPPGPPLDAARPQPRSGPARRGARARGVARRAQRRRLPVSRGGQRRRQGRDGRAQGRARHAPSAVGDRAPARAVRRGRRLGQRRGTRVRGERGGRHAQGPDARAGPPRRAAGRPAGSVADSARRLRVGRCGRRQRRRGPREERGGERLPAGDLGPPGGDAPAAAAGEAQGDRRDIPDGDAAQGGDGAARA